MMRGTALRLTAGPLSAALLFCACYRYVPTQGPDLVVGAVYRGHLSPDGSDRVARLMGADVTLFDGRVLTASDSLLLVAMSSTVKRSDPRRIFWSGEQLTVPRAAVLTFERRQLDRGKTTRAILLTAAGLLATGAIWLSIKGRVSGSPGDGGGITPF